MTEARAHGAQLKRAGPYRLVEYLGSGSFGEVWAGRRSGTNELAAVKVAHESFHDDADFQGRFKREIESIGLVDSEFVPKLLDSHSGGPPWLASELISGLPLHAVVPSSGLIEGSAVWQLGAGIANALEAIHAAGCIHRDLRPPNVLLTRNRVWVVDFSLAHLIDLAHSADSLAPRRVNSGYMSPEEAADGLRAAEEPADIFGFGATLVFAATGHPPFDVNNPVGNGAGPNLARFPDDLRDITQRCLSHEPGRRPALGELLRIFGEGTGLAKPDRLADALPPDMVTRLGGHADSLAAKINGRGPAKFGWDYEGPEGPGTVAARQSRRTRVSPARRPVRPSDSPDNSDLAPVWEGRFGDWVSGAIAVRGGKLIAACLDGTVRALRTADGKAAWRRPVKVGSELHAGPLALIRPDRRGIAYVGGTDGRVVEIDLESGTDHEVLKAASAIEGTPVVAGNFLYATSADGWLYFADLDSGESGRRYYLGAAATGALSVTPGSAPTVFCADVEGGVHAVDPRYGRRKWRFDTNGLVVGAPLPWAGWLYVGGTDLLLRQLSVDDGVLRDAHKLSASVHAAPVRQSNRLYVGSCDGRLHAYEVGGADAAGLSRLWPPVSLGPDIEIAGLATADDRVYVAAGYHLVEVRDEGEHSMLWRLDSLIGAAPVIVAKHCYVVALDGSAICLALRR